MEKLKKMSPEVLMYIQTVKNFLKKNDASPKYFAVDRNEDVFFEYISELSQKNFEENENPQLTLEQFELLRKRMRGTSDEEHKVLLGQFIFFGDYGYMSLN